MVDFLFVCLFGVCFFVFVFTLFHTTSFLVFEKCFEGGYTPERRDLNDLKCKFKRARPMVLVSY